MDPLALRIALCNSLRMHTFREVIDLWPSQAAMAADLGVERGAIAVWKHRNSIPPEHWPVVIAKAAIRGLQGITLETLAAARRNGRSAA
jgi:hypothetical protein